MNLLQQKYFKKGRESNTGVYYSKQMKKIQTALLSAGSVINAKTIGLMSFCGIAALPVASAFAATDLFDSAKSLIKTIYEGVAGISTVLAVVLAIIACLFWMFSSNPRTVETAKSWLKRILIAWIVINALGLIVSSLSTWLSDAGATNADDLFK